MGYDRRFGGMQDGLTGNRTVAYHEQPLGCKNKEVAVDAKDRIERQMTFQAPRDDVWAAITEPEQIRKWFGTEAEVDLRPGGEGAFRWDDIEVRVTVEEVTPPSRFSYRWEPSQTPTGGPTTLVQFDLEEIPGGTRLTLVESGFATLPRESRQENEFGWDEEFGHLRAFLLEKEPAR
jgi:uncharacterized protein YndB with AHSA1/START domain